MAPAKEGNTVKVHYTGKFKDGMAFDSSAGADPLEFKIGTGRLIPGFEEAVIGMSPGESKTVNIPAEKAYGRYHEERVINVDLKDLPSEIEPEIGMTLEVCGPSGQVIPVQITDIQGNTVTLDANHPLAEQDLIFEIQMVEIVE
jgi:peptidylprolyl isomerase